MLRRYLLLVSLMFWQGGFMFYGGVVVPVGSQVLGSDTAQGFITRAVTNYLNLAGFVCLVIWCENLWHARKSGTSKWEWISWGVMSLLLIFLALIHLRMDQALDPATKTIVDHSHFGGLHKLYIGSSSVQWAVSLFALWLVLQRWNQRHPA